MKTLFQYLSDTGTTQQAFAERLNTSQANVSRWVAGKSVPQRAMMARIAEATDGAVPIMAWFQEAAE